MNKNELKGLGPNSKKLRQYKESLVKLSQTQWEAAIGLMLGDASLQTQNGGKTYRMKFEWGARSKAYLDHVYGLMDEWVLTEPHKKTRISPKGNEVINWGFQTISHEAFNSLAELFINKKKIISQDLIKNHLTPRGLAYWFMDDGGKLDYNKNSKNKGVVLNTQSFEAKEVQVMAEQLSEKFNFECEIRSNKGKKVIVIKSSSFPLFLSLIDPYILPEMRYKLP
uniref:LAGLIDADG endonuclease n=1 Tax=Pyronema omphalodes TaxID=337075 RepID=A0A140IMY6_9PEZI|nr:LAGLIDADG endonuclease [Pyronema omphalodes]AMO66544.1 LAGLIDADG endonuclease [Pyronema omphalodes]